MKQPRTSIPLYDLYGESHSGSVYGSIHVETLHVRAEVHAWTILAHRHPSLSQIFVFGNGGGIAEIDGQNHVISPPAIVWLPAGCVHGFAFEPDTEGLVLTAADDSLAPAMIHAPECAETLRTPRMLGGLTEAVAARLQTGIATIGEEIASRQPGARAAALHHLGLLLVEMSRLAQTESEQPLTGARAVHRAFRELVDQNFRARWSIPLYARRLGITADRLHAICSDVTGQPPTEIVQERVMVEARRALIYTGMTIAEIAFDLGFDDPAYFSRFFSKRAGVSPATFRAQR